MLFASAPAMAQHWPDEECFENPNLRPCLQSRADSLAETYGVRRIEAHRDAGDEVLRVFYIKDGDRALISLVRTPGREPMAYVHFPRTGNQPAPPAMQAQISQAAWSEALYRAALADRSLASIPEGAEVRTICIHPWNYVFEASEPAEAANETSARIRRHSASNCEYSPLLYFAADLQRLVLPLFPACDALDRDRHGNPVQRLIQCQRLSGDRLVAAEVMNLASAFIGLSQESHALDELFSWNAAIDWNGRRSGPNAREAADFWRARVAEDDVTAFHVEVAEGQSRNRVRLTGYLFRDQPGTDDGTQSRARFEQIWASTGSGIQVTSVTVGPWQVYRPR
jgi:hypothetical protein